MNSSLGGLSCETMRFPDKLSQSVYQNLLPFQASLITERLRRFRQNVRAGQVPDYEREAAAFCYLYFGSNALKTFTALRHLPTPKEAKIFRLLDLGCGSGASTAGALLALTGWLSEQQGRRIELTAVDRSNKQLNLYRGIIANWLHAEQSVNIQTRIDDALTYLSSRNVFHDAIISCYLLDEQPLAMRGAIKQRLIQLSQVGVQVVLIGSSASGRCIVEFIGDHHSSFSLKLESSQVQLGQIPSLNVEEAPMYASEA